MRVSTLLSQQIGVRTMATQEAKMLHTMQQLASGKRLLTPADDPLAAAQAVNVAQTEGMNTRFGTNRGIAEQNLASEENVLDNITTALQGVLGRVVEAGNGSYSDGERRVLANVLRQTRDSLMGNANATDGNGQYIFSGDRGNVAPYDTETGAYLGNNGERLVQVGQTRQMSTSDTGLTVFSRTAPGTQTYVATSGPGNEGTGTFGKVEIVDVSDSGLGKDFSIVFSEEAGPDGPQLMYAVNGGDPVAYEEGAAIQANGVSLAISGKPEAGDSFQVSSAANLDDQAGFSVFGTLDDLITALESPTEGDPAAMANLSNALATANRKLNLHLDNVLTVRASVGARMNELDALGDEGSMRNLNYKAQLSSLEDVDYREASTNIAVQQVALQAAELAYMKTQGLGLFSRG
jgi:flagellar hook-associated protein 3 FlgL